MFQKLGEPKSGGNRLIGHFRFRGVHYNNSLTFEQTHLLELFHNPIRARSHESSSAPKTKVSLLSRGTLLHVGVQGVIIGLLGGPGAVWVPRSALFEGLALWPAEPPPPTRPGLVGDLADVVLDMVRLPQCALAAVVGRRPVARTCGGGGGAVGLCRGTYCAAVVPLCAVACAPSAPATLPERAQRCGPLGHAWSRPLG